jgi:hypothetical protein
MLLSAGARYDPGMPPDPDADPLDALAAAADELHDAPDGFAALGALRRAEEALARIPRSRERAAELSRAHAAVARARPLAAAGAAAELRAVACRLYESAVLMLEPVRPPAVVHLMLLRLLLRRADAASGTAGTQGPDRLLLLARAVLRALALAEHRDRRSPILGALELVLADAHTAACARDRDPMRDAAHRAIRMLDELQAEMGAGSRDRPDPRTPGGGAPC